MEESSFTLDKSTNTFWCIFCNTRCSNKTDIVAHMDSHVMNCNECHKPFQNPFFLGLHTAEHNSDRTIYCPLCKYSCRLAIVLKKHICNLHFDNIKIEKISSDDGERERRKTSRRVSKETEDEDNSKYDEENFLVEGAKDSEKKEGSALNNVQLTCLICNKKYPTMKGLENHKKIHRAERLEALYTFNLSRKCYSCDTCSQEFPTEEDIKNHAESHSYTCNICSMKFKKVYLLGLHMAEHNPDGSISCSLCNHEFKTRVKTSLKRHIKLKHQNVRPSTSQCEYCGSSYLSKAMLADHIRVVHLKKEPYKCIVCGNTFTLKSSMRIHQINKHRVVDESELSSNYCALCKLSFKKPSSFLKHLDMKRCIPTPRVERQGHFVCDMCGKEFRFYKTLNLHIREHAGDKPFKCSYCPKSFVINSKRLTHEVSHTDFRPFSCETCGQSYKTWKHLRRHLAIHKTTLTKVAPDNLRIVQRM